MSIGIPNPRPTFPADSLRPRSTFAPPRLDANDPNVRSYTLAEYEAECGPSMFSYSTIEEGMKARAEWRAKQAREKQEETGEGEASGSTNGGIRGFFRRLLGKK